MVCRGCQKLKKLPTYFMDAPKEKRASHINNVHIFITYSLRIWSFRLYSTYVFRSKWILEETLIWFDCRPFWSRILRWASPWLYLVNFERTFGVFNSSKKEKTKILQKNWGYQKVLLRLTDFELEKKNYEAMITVRLPL